MSILKVLRSTPIKFNNAMISVLHSKNGYGFNKNYVIRYENGYTADVDKLYAISIKNYPNTMYQFDIPGIIIVGYSVKYMKFMYVMHSFIHKLPIIFWSLYIIVMIWMGSEIIRISEELEKKENEERNSDEPKKNK